MVLLEPGQTLLVYSMVGNACRVPCSSSTKSVFKTHEVCQMAERRACCSLPHRNQCICRVTRLFFYKTIKLKRQNTCEFILLFNLTAWKKQKTKQNPQWLLHPIPPPHAPPPFQKLCTVKTKKERGYLPQSLAEPFAVTTVGTAVYTDTLPVAECNASAPVLCK